MLSRRVAAAIGRSPFDSAENYGPWKGPLRMWPGVRAASFGT